MDKIEELNKKRESKRGKDKRGVSHVEMIVSFSVFLLFVLFLITYLNPIKPPTISKVLLDIVEQGLKNYTAKILEIAVRAAPSAGCFQIECPFVDCSADHVFVKDKNGNSIGYDILPNGNLSIKGDFYYLYHSDKSVSLSGSGCAGALTTSPIFSVPKLQTLYLYSELKTLNSTYYSDYESIKTQFRFPSASDFAINIRYEDDTPMFIMSTTKPKGIAVKARDMPVSILNGDTKEIIKGKMNIQVW